MRPILPDSLYLELPGHPAQSTQCSPLRDRGGFRVLTLILICCTTLGLSLKLWVSGSMFIKCAEELPYSIPWLFASIIIMLYFLSPMNSSDPFSVFHLLWYLRSHNLNYWELGLYFILLSHWSSEHTTGVQRTPVTQLGDESFLRQYQWVQTAITNPQVSRGSLLFGYPVLSSGGRGRGYGVNGS